MEHLYFYKSSNYQIFIKTYCSHLVKIISITKKTPLFLQSCNPLIGGRVEALPDVTWSSQETFSLRALREKHLPEWEVSILTPGLPHSSYHPYHWSLWNVFILHQFHLQLNSLSGEALMRSKYIVCHGIILHLMEIMYLGHWCHHMYSFISLPISPLSRNQYN